MSEIAKGERAKQLLEDPLMVEALAAIKENVRGLFFDLPSESREQREFLHLMDKARQQFETCLKLHIYGMQIEKSELLAKEHAEARLEAVRRRVM